MHVGLAGNVQRVDDVASFLPLRLSIYIKNLSDVKKGQVREIRLRAGKPLAVNLVSADWLFQNDGSLAAAQTSQSLIVTKDEVNECFKKLCGYSVYSHQNEIASGFITVKNGHRAGVCGTAVVEEGKITGLRDISSVNIRVAREINGAADEIFNRVLSQGLCGLLICGVPASGKTTVLRDLARQLSINNTRVAIVDERGELAATHCGQAENNLGPRCDVLDGYPKGEGLMIAVKCLAPDVIICDEIGSEEEAKAIQTGLNCGVCVVASAHAADIEELRHKKQIMRLIALGAFPNIVFLHGADAPGKIKEIIKAGEWDAQSRRGHLYNHNLLGGWSIHVPQADRQSKLP